VAAKPAAPVAAHKSHSTTVSKSAKSSAPTAAAAPPPAAQAPAKPPVQHPTPAKASNGPNDTALEIGGGALALLALGGAAFAIARRRRSENEDEWYEEQPYEETYGEPTVAAEEPVAGAAMPRHDPIAEQQSAIVAPAASAFSWGDSKEGASSSNDGSDRRPGETWVERAYRGPSPANPSVSLRNRLRRAAFFDKRERDVAEGRAVPVEAGAGLPDGASEERELA
jgi:resuscitation-promoting factor RpfA